MKVSTKKWGANFCWNWDLTTISYIKTVVSLCQIVKQEDDNILSKKKIASYLTLLIIYETWNFFLSFSGQFKNVDIILHMHPSYEVANCSNFCGASLQNITTLHVLPVYFYSENIL